MASSLKLSELPSSSTFNNSDLFLVADVINGQSKSVRFDSLNSALVFQNMSGYDTYVADMEEVSENITNVIGSFSDGTFRSLGDLFDVISSNATLETTRYESVSNLIDTLDDRVTLELTTNSDNIAAIFNRLTELEEMQFQAGLATGYLYAQNVTVGEI